MREYDPCIGCEYYNKPYWSIVSPCTSCPKVHNTGGYVTTNIKVENHDDLIVETTLEYFAKIAEDKMNVEKAMDFLRNLGIQGKIEQGNYRPTHDVLRDLGEYLSKNND